MAEYKVTYFNVSGAAEPIRWLFSYAGIKFEDERIESEKWPQYKEKTPFGKVPLLTDLKTGKVMNQSVPICEFVAKKCNLVGSNDWENMEIQAIVHTFLDMKPMLHEVYHEKDPEAKKEKIKKFVDETFSYYVKKFEAIIDKNNGYVAIGKLTWADIYIAAMTERMSKIFKDAVDIFEKYPIFGQHCKKITAIPSIKKWIENRPKSEFLSVN